MSLILIKEDGTGRTDANSYASAADGDTYHDGHLYATAWTAATSGNKEKALVMATRLIDAHFRFNGARQSDRQALQWPRVGCPDPDGGGWVEPLRSWPVGEDCFPSSAVPAGVVAAACEMARELLVADRTAAPLGEGLMSSQVGDSKMVFDRAGRAPVLSHVTIALLSKVGVYVGEASGAVRLVRC